MGPTAMKTTSEHFTQATESTASVDKVLQKDTSERDCDKPYAPWPSGPPSLLLSDHPERPLHSHSGPKKGSVNKARAGS